MPRKKTLLLDPAEKTDQPISLCPICNQKADIPMTAIEVSHVLLHMEKEGLVNRS
jgi:hypothetical protein